MKCPFCHNEQTKVVEKRDLKNNELTRRRRECEFCKKRFTTYEKIAKQNLTVIKKNGLKERYDQEKLRKSIFLATQKRADLQSIEDLVENIESRIFNDFDESISSSEIGRIALKHLFSFDKVSYLRFASVFLDFNNLEDFTGEIEKALPKN